MKVLTQSQLDDANNVFLVNGAKGALGCFAATLGAIVLLPRYTRFGKSLTIPLKAFFVTSLSTAGFVIYGEHALLEYDRAQHSPKEISPVKNEFDFELSPLLRAKNFVYDNRFQLVLGTWVGSMSIAGFFLYRRKYMTTAQKLIEARMYAQAITVGSLGAVALFSAGATNNKKGSS